MIREFKSYLLDKKHIRDKYVPYYIKWVSDCYSYLDESAENRLTTDKIQVFLRYLSKNHEDWQVNQADYALRLYQFFLSREKHDKGAKEAGTLDAWKELEDETRNMLRLKHRSLSTEKTYIGWFRRFKDFIKEKAPGNLEGNDLQDFLSHLAVDERVSTSTQNQALNAIVFVYKHVLDKDIENTIRKIGKEPVMSIAFTMAAKA